MNRQEFQETVWQHGRRLYRPMLWRDEPTFYYVLVSEIMLQQTQVPRVLVKFDEFMQAFPTMRDLAEASLADVLKTWSGLGYNRRAKFLHDAAKTILTHGEPNTLEGLVALPGVGKNTAAAIMNYVYEIPTAFVETNIRTVYFHHFFPDVSDISDRQIIDLVDGTIETEHPREWFWVLMDYGAWLKSQGYGRLSQSRHYKKQAPLGGSVREVRGRIIRLLGTQDYTIEGLREAVSADERFDGALDGLLRDMLIEKDGDAIHLTR